MLTLSMKYDLDAWPRNSSHYFKFKNCLFDGAGSWTFVNDFARYVIFGVDNSYHIILIFARIRF